MLPPSFLVKNIYGGHMSKAIQVVPYDPSWPDQYAEEAEAIKTALGNHLIAIHHVGSTAVLGLSAKPKIDIIAEVEDGKSVIEPLSSIDFKYCGEWNIPFKFGFSKRGARDVNLHVFEEGHPEIELNLLFRDYLRENEEALNRYAELKRVLLTDEKSLKKQGGQRFSGYNLGKHSFIQEILKKTGFKRLRFLKCSHHDEWSAARKYRQHYFSKEEAAFDPYNFNVNDENDEHFVMYEGTEVIGYAHVQLCVDFRSAIRIMVIDQSKQDSFLELFFVTFIEKWLLFKTTI